MASKLKGDRINIGVDTGSKSTTGAEAGDIYLDSANGTIRFYNNGQWVATNLTPKILSVSGTIWNGESSTLTASVQDTTDSVAISFYEGATLLARVSGLTVSSGSVNVTVPSQVYGQSYGDTITIFVENIDGTPSTSGINKTVDAKIGSALRRATSVSQISAAGHDNGDGVYYYSVNGVNFSAYTNFSYSHSTHGSGWMLIGRVASGTTFNILSSNWTNSSTFGSTTSYTATDNMKNEGWKQVNHNVMMFQFKSTMSNSDLVYTTVTHNKNTTTNGIFNWNNDANGFITFPEQFTTNGGYTTELNNYLDAVGYTDSRPGSPFGKLGINVFMTTGTSSAGTERNWDQMSYNTGGQSGCRYGFLGDGSSGGGVWPGQTGGPDDYFVGLSGQHCYDSQSCNAISSSQYPGSYRMQAATNNDTGQFFTRCNVWIKN